MNYSGKKKNTLKIIVIGDSGVGKTSLIQTYFSGKFSNTHRPTLGADFVSGTVNLNGKEITMQVWDTAGQEKFQSIGTAFYRGSDCCVIVYDITNPTSFEKMNNWKHEFIEQGGITNAEKFPFVIIGNKCDKEAERKVQKEKATAWCENSGNNMKYFEASAKSDIGVKAAFEKVAEMASEMGKEEEIYIPVPSISLNDSKKKKKAQKEECKC
jgi:Ras-related protein Rab-7A